MGRVVMCVEDVFFFKTSMLNFTFIREERVMGLLVLGRSCIKLGLRLPLCYRLGFLCKFQSCFSTSSSKILLGDQLSFCPVRVKRISIILLLEYIVIFIQHKSLKFGLLNMNTINKHTVRSCFMYKVKIIFLTYLSLLSKSQI